MRRTGKDFDSPTTGSKACGGTGMTKELAFMKGSGGLGEEIRVRIYAVAGIGARVRAPVSRCCRPRTRPSGALLLRLEHDEITSRLRGNGSALSPACVACLKASCR